MSGRNCYAFVAIVPQIAVAVDHDLGASRTHKLVNWAKTIIYARAIESPAGEYLARFAESRLSDSSLPLATSPVKEAFSARIFVAKSGKSAINSGKSMQQKSFEWPGDENAPDLSTFSGQTIQEF